MARSGAEKCTLVFGIISVAAATAGIAVYTGLIVYVITQLEHTIDSDDYLNYILNLGLILGLTILFFVFAVILLNGVYKKKYNQVLAYVVFGILLTSLSLAGAVAYTVMNPWDTMYVAVSGIWFLITLIHVVILVVVWIAYRKIKQEKQPNRPILTLTREEMKEIGVAK